MIRCNQISMFLDVNLPFTLIVTAKTSAPEQFERPPFWKPCWRLGRIAWRYCAREAQISGRQHYQMQNGSGRGCGNRTPRDFKRGISFHRLPLKNKPFLKEWLVRIKWANVPKLSQCHVNSEHFEKECFESCCNLSLWPGRKSKRKKTCWLTSINKGLHEDWVNKDIEN